VGRSHNIEVSLGWLLTSNERPSLKRPFSNLRFFYIGSNVNTMWQPALIETVFPMLLGSQRNYLWHGFLPSIVENYYTSGIFLRKIR